jgi:hypothetical protein
MQRPEDRPNVYFGVLSFPKSIHTFGTARLGVDVVWAARVTLPFEVALESSAASMKKCGYAAFKIHCLGRLLSI